MIYNDVVDMENNILSMVNSSRPIVLFSERGEFFYLDKFRVLIPIKQDEIKREYGIYDEILTKHYQLNSIPVKMELVKAHHAVEIFTQLTNYLSFIANGGDNNLRNLINVTWDLATPSLWHVNNWYPYIKELPTEGIVYDGKTKEIKIMSRYCKARILRVIYLQGKKIFEGGHVNTDELRKYGLWFPESFYGQFAGYKQEKTVTTHQTQTDKKVKKDSSEKDVNSEMISQCVQNLIDCDKKRCGLASYEQEMLYDIKAGHWDVFEKGIEEFQNEKNLVARDPKMDIKKNGVIGIDFGTKSTVVMRQEGSNEIRPLRIGSLSLKAEVSESDYENPTIISCINLHDFFAKYEELSGRPDTSCDDLFVSYNAYQDYKNCPTGNFYAYYSDLKQWANSEKTDAIVQDIKNREKYILKEESSLDKKTLNPIEIYAYYIGMYINNMRNGIYLKYIMSFPVRYSKETKALIRASFEKGLKKSLPKSIVDDAEIMSKYSVEYQISEPAAYAVTALEQSGFMPKNENEKYLYGIFDFGGGTTDFDFGVWRGATDDEYDKYNCDYVLECFGADSDVTLGGENILEMLAYHVFKKNKKMASEKRIACACPVDQNVFIGGEHLVNNSQSANRNLAYLKEALRPLWEQHDKWEDLYRKKNNKQNSKDAECNEKKEEFIELLMFDFNGQPVPNCKFVIDTNELIGLIKERIDKGVDAFFKCIEKSILRNKSAQFASEKIYIFLAGNSCKSIFVREIFEKMIHEYNKEYAKYREKEQDRFELIAPLSSVEMDEKYIPNAKTSVAYGLVRSRPGGKIYVKKNYETDSSEETRFKYYLGTDRRGCFECKLAPMIQDENGESKTSYHVWYKFHGAGTGIARLYYTEDSRADSKGDKLAIDNIPFHEITFDADENKYLFIKAVNPTTIAYTIAGSIEDIGNSITELDIDKF